MYQGPSYTCTDPREPRYLGGSYHVPLSACSSHQPAHPSARTQTRMWVRRCDPSWPLTTQHDLLPQIIPVSSLSPSLSNPKVEHVSGISWASSYKVAASSAFSSVTYPVRPRARTRAFREDRSECVLDCTSHTLNFHQFANRNGGRGKRKEVKEKANHAVPVPHHTSHITTPHPPRQAVPG
jgi:hypothetical protein